MTKPKPSSEQKAYRGKQSYLTEEQIAVLEKNPNVVRVTPRQVHYTQTFKNYFCREYAKGRSSSDILREQGIDPKILGETRVSSLRTTITASKELSLAGSNYHLKARIRIVALKVLATLSFRLTQILST